MILTLVERSGYDHVKLEFDNLKLEVRRSAEGRPGLEALQDSRPVRSLDLLSEPYVVAAVQPLPAVSAPAVPASPNAADVIPPGCIAIRSPSIGTFYRATSPDQPPLVVVGSKVNVEDTVGLVEVMKLFNSIHSGVSGTVLEVRAENGAFVEFGQVLMILRPDEAAE